MPFEVKLENKDGKVAYRDGVYKIEDLGDNLYLFYDNEDAAELESSAEILTQSENIESFTDANIKIVKDDRGHTIKELEEKEWEEQEEMIEHQWENPHMQGEMWDDVDSLEEAKAKFKRMKFGEEESPN